MAFTDDDIQTLVSTGQFSDPEAAAWLVKCLVERRNRIGRSYLGRVLPLDNFTVENGRLVFDDLRGPIRSDAAAHVHRGVAFGSTTARDSSLRSASSSSFEGAASGSS